jgi:Nuclear transport factor 2 (NTF2) domain
MSFTLFRSNNNSQLIDIRYNYKQLAEELCKYYYTAYDNNFMALANVYYDDSQFTYQDNEFSGFNTLLQALRGNNINKFTHHNMTASAQPIGPNNLLIVVYGSISFNDSIFMNKFIETLYLQKDDSNVMRICSTIFKVID